MTSPPPGYPAPQGYVSPPGYGPPTSGYAPPVPRPTGPGGVPLAEFGERLLAYLLDGVVLAAILVLPTMAGMLALLIPYAHAVDAASHGGQADVAVIVGSFLGIFVWILGAQFLGTYLYQVTYQLRAGQTVGKRVMKLKVVDAESGAAMAAPAARKRWIIHLLFGFLGPLTYLDGLWQLWDPQKQTLHDKVARTVVVKVPA